MSQPATARILDSKYELQSQIGRGSMGAIYRARRLEDDTLVAVKLIHKRLTRDPEVKARFEREIRSTHGLRHPHIVRVLDHGLHEGVLYLVMELLNGRTLRQVSVMKAPLPPRRVAELGRQIALALGAAHDLGLVHRDRKPENILILRSEEGQDVVKVLDFGLAIMTDPNKRDGARMTAQGMRLGTPAFMAPEYIAQGCLDYRSDLYSLGAILYELACGEPPFVGKGFQLMQHHIMSDVPPLAARCDAPEGLIELIEQLLVKDPEGRPTSAHELCERLARVSC